MGAQRPTAPNCDSLSLASDGRERLPPWSSMPRRPQPSPFRAPGDQPPSATVNSGPCDRD